MTDLYQELQEENDQLRKELDLWQSWCKSAERKADELGIQLSDMKRRLIAAEKVIRKWLAAALEMEDVSDEMKADIETWFEIVGMP